MAPYLFSAVPFMLINSEAVHIIMAHYFFSPVFAVHLPRVEAASDQANSAEDEAGPLNFIRYRRVFKKMCFSYNYLFTLFIGIP